MIKWSRCINTFFRLECILIFTDTLEFLERGEFVKDYSSIALNVDSEDDDDPRTPASVSSQDSQGLDLADVEAFTVISDSSMPELNLQVKYFLSNYAFVHKVILVKKSILLNVTAFE